VLCYAPKKCIKKILKNCHRIYGTWPKPATSPLVSGDHPELDTSELLNEDDQKICQSLIGAPQWAIQIGRFDIQTAVISLSRFRAVPRQGHLDRIKRIHGYLSKMRHATIKTRTDAPDCSNIPVKLCDWECSCCADTKEEIPLDAPAPKGKPVTMLTCATILSVVSQLETFSTNSTRLLSIGVLSCNRLLRWQHLVRRTCTEQVIDLHLALRYLGVPPDGPTMVIGDNESVIN